MLSASGLAGVATACAVLVAIQPAHGQSPGSLTPHRVRIEEADYLGKHGVRLVEDGEVPNGQAYAIVKDSAFHNGRIEVELAGRPLPGTFAAARGYVGIVFRLKDERFEYIYLRPTNGRADDQIRRNHTTQYSSFPSFDFATARKEAPEKYESYVDVEAGAWTRVAITVDGSRARLFVNGAGQPSLIVNGLKLGDATGGVGLWIGPGTEGFFRDLSIRASGASSPAVAPTVAPSSRTDENRLDATARRMAVERLARSLETLYVKPALGEALARHVRERLATRSYEQLSDPRAFADALSRDLDSLAHDLHLWVRYFPPMANAPQGPDLDDTWLNHGYPSVSILDGNIGYLEVRNFLPGPPAIRAMTAAMSLLRDCDALIVDIRSNGGGAAPMMARLASYLFADSVHLADLYWRDLPDTVRGWTQPGSVDVHLSKQRVYVVTSRRTFSAAEAFAYALQELRRATIVGERTRGGAHSAKGGPQDLGSGLRALVPSGESVGVRSKQNWERVGVTPDIVADDSLALRVARHAALEALISEAQPGLRRNRLERALNGLE